ncbi:MAG: hypothetical protein ACREIS_02500 [Nitrospiraceae bacterium]
MTTRLAGRTRFFAYRAYGVVLHCAAPLPELARTDDEVASTDPDITLRFARTSRLHRAHAPWFLSVRNPHGRPGLRCAKTRDGYLLQVPGFAEFEVDEAGCQITALALPRLAKQDLRHLLLDQVLPLVLTLRGREALHATAVLTPFGVCAFSGPTGVGKSTLAAAFHLSGHPVICDDCLVLVDESDAVQALHGYPGLRLHRDAIQALAPGHPPARRPRAHAKHRLTSGPWQLDIQRTPRPLARIYLLDRQLGAPGDASAAPLIRPLSGREAMIGLLSHAFRLDITDRRRLIRQFEFLDWVIRRVPVRQVLLPNSLTRLPDVHAAVLADAAAE